MKTNQNEINIQCDIDMFVAFLKDLVSAMDRREEVKEMISKIYSELFDDEIPVMVGVDDEHQKTNYPVNVKAHRNEIGIEFVSEQNPTERVQLWMNREKLHRFINDFMKACSKAFPE